MDTTTLLIIIVIVLLVFGGGFYGRGRWFESFATRDAPGLLLGTVANVARIAVDASRASLSVLGDHPPDFVALHAYSVDRK